MNQSIDVESVNQQTLTIGIPLETIGLQKLADLLLQSSVSGYKLTDILMITSGQRDPYVIGAKIVLSKD